MGILTQKVIERRFKLPGCFPLKKDFSNNCDSGIAIRQKLVTIGEMNDFVNYRYNYQ